MTGFAVGVPPIVLTTDFGLSDAFVGVMKGVILGINPAAWIIDLTHDIQPQNLGQGAFLLGVNHTYFPSGTIHTAVVDPGVGTDRRALALQTPTATFVAPDNGLLSEVVKQYLDATPDIDPAGSLVRLPAELTAYEITNPRYRLEPVSSTFHGRDVFAPAAAHLSLGLAPAELGPQAAQIIYRPLPEPGIRNRQVSGQVIYIDRFGNLITNISQATLHAAGYDAANAVVVIGPRRIRGLSRTFHDPAAELGAQPDGLPLAALLGSSGYLEIAVPDGSAAAELGLGVGTPVRVGPAS